MSYTKDVVIAEQNQNKNQTPLIKPEVKKLWVDALRSGKYTQCRKFLSLNNEFCCLGVLCEELIRTEQVELKVEQSPFFSKYYDNNNSMLPSAVKDYISIEKEDPWKIGNANSLYTILVGMNDDEYKSFSEIADYIEANA